MPFETVHYGRVDTNPVDGTGYITPELTLHWHAGPDEPVQFVVKIDRQVIVETARLIAAGHYGADKAIEFASAPMERGELNTGIRAMRRARNARFEADE